MVYLRSIMKTMVIVFTFTLWSASSLDERDSCKKVYTAQKGEDCEERSSVLVSIDV